MPKEEWGVKRLCPTTGKRFYDLNRSPVVSPYTGEVVEVETSGRKGALGGFEAPEKGRKKADETAETEDVLLDDDVDTDDDLLEDDDDDTVSFDELSDVSDEEEN